MKDNKSTYCNIAKHGKPAKRKQELRLYRSLKLLKLSDHLLEFCQGIAS